MQPVVYFAGNDHTVGHHAAPLESQFDVRVLSPEQIVQQATAGDLVVFYTEHFDSFREASLQLSKKNVATLYICLLYTSPSPRDRQKSRMPSSA